MNASNAFINDFDALKKKKEKKKGKKRARNIKD